MTIASSAKLKIFKLLKFCISLTYMRKSISPRIDTCGTPQVNDFWEDLILYIVY